MKHLIFIIFAVFGIASASSQIIKEDSVVNVVAYFCKGDTMIYEYNNVSYKTTKGDTTDINVATEQFRLCVTDSTSKGYTLEYTPLSFEYSDTTNLEGKIKQELSKMNVGKKLIFTTDEYGKLKRVLNWKENSRLMKDMIKLALDTLFASEGMDKVFSRKAMEKSLSKLYESEESVLSCYEEITDLMQFHSMQLQYNLPKTTKTPATKDEYASETYAVVTDDDMMDGDEKPYDGDYKICVNTTQYVPASDLVKVIGQAFQTGTDEMKKVLEMPELKQTVNDASKSGALVCDKVDNHYFFNGWPKYIYSERTVSVPSAEMEKVSIKEISWLSRRFGF